MLFSKYFQQKRNGRKAEVHSALLHHEAKMGGKLFGSIPEGHRREFFCLDEKTWVWHEEWLDEHKEWHAMTTRYDVRPNGIMKTQGDQPSQLIGRSELVNFYRAVNLYVNHAQVEQKQMLAAM